MYNHNGIPIVQLLPEAGTGRNLHVYYPEHWDKIRHAVYRFDAYTCRLCGSSATMPEAHEQWFFTQDEQRLEDIYILCTNCHRAIHFLGRDKRKWSIGKHCSYLAKLTGQPYDRIFASYQESKHAADLVDQRLCLRYMNFGPVESLLDCAPNRLRYDQLARVLQIMRFRE